MAERTLVNNMQKNVLATKEKSKIYELFANIFAKEPNEEFLQVLKLEENEKLFEFYNIDCLSDIRRLSIEEQKELIAVEYARLFLAPLRLVSPYESIQRGEGRLWGDSAVKVNNIYKKFGFRLDDSFRDAPDHLSAELSFLVQLSKLEGGYNEKNYLEAKTGVLEVKKYFLKNHLLQWFFRFKEGIDKNAKIYYYKEMVKFLDLFLYGEMEALKEIRDI